jgi:GNAT superfamily N-acetyltransferase
MTVDPRAPGAAAAIGQPGHAVLIASHRPGNRSASCMPTLMKARSPAKGRLRVGVAVTAAAVGSGVGRRLMRAAEDWPDSKAAP